MHYSSFDWENNKSPLAIVMWDFSWLMHHYPGGAFEDFDRCLDGLVERGYNAVRLDCFPQLIADSETRKAEACYFHPKPSTVRELWQNPYSIDSRPAESLVSMLQKCADRGIRYGLSAWFLSHGTNRNKEFTNVEGLVRAWDETLTMIAEAGLLEDILYVDLLNEYPLWHGFVWLKDEMARIARQQRGPDDEEKANEPPLDVMMGKWSGYDAMQTAFYCGFINEVIDQLKSKWPDLRFFASQTLDYAVPWSDTDHSRFEIMDIHLWFILYRPMAEASGYFPRIHARENDREYRECQSKIREFWDEHQDSVLDWFKKEMKARSEVARTRGVPLGNTEGWGPIIWEEHPYLDWDFAKEAAELAIPLARQHGYQFICTSNFTHPQFPGIWNDVSWHRRMTELIRQPLV